MPDVTTYSTADARSRVGAMLDPGFQEFLPPPDRVISPYLEALGQPVELDDGILVGRGHLRGHPVLVAAQQGAFVGGAVGEVHGAEPHRADPGRCARLGGGVAGGRLGGAAPRVPAGCSSTGSAGEIAISEAMRAVFEAREAGCSVIAVIGGDIGAYGGIGIFAACCDRVVMTEHGRWGISGPIVIQQQMGAEEYDADDRALVWRTSGGKTHYAFGDADVLVDDTVEAVADTVDQPCSTPPVPVDLPTLRIPRAPVPAAAAVRRGRRRRMSGPRWESPTCRRPASPRAASSTALPLLDRAGIAR